MIHVGNNAEEGFPFSVFTRTRRSATARKCGDKLRGMTEEGPSVLSMFATHERAARFYVKQDWLPPEAVG
jgi:hypothetical protein